MLISDSLRPPILNDSTRQVGLLIDSISTDSCIDKVDTVMLVQQVKVPEFTLHFNSEHRQESISNIFPILFSLLITGVVIAYTNRVFATYYQKQFSRFLLGKQFSKDELRGLKPILTSLNRIALLSLLSAYMFNGVQIFSSKGYINLGTWFTFSVILILLAIGKRELEKGIAGVFNIQERIELIHGYYDRISFWLIFPLLFSALTMVSSNSVFNVVVWAISGFLLLLYYLVKIFRTYFLAQYGSFSMSLYFILYICTLEIAPLAISIQFIFNQIAKSEF